MTLPINPNWESASGNYFANFQAITGEPGSVSEIVWLCGDRRVLKTKRLPRISLIPQIS